MALRLITREEVSPNGHLFVAFDLDPDSTWLHDLAQEYRNLLTEFAATPPAVQIDDIDVLDVSRVRSIITAHLTPRRRGGFQDVVRSDFGEVLAYRVLEEEFGTTIGFKSVRERERIDMPARGLDIVGVEEREKVRLLLGGSEGVR